MDAAVTETPSLPDLLNAAGLPIGKGDRSGRCAVCGRITDCGHPLSFSSNFTSWSLLEDGDCLCPACHFLVKNQDFRRKSWAVSMSGGLKFLTRKEVMGLLIDPPEPPFAVYISASGKKQGFLLLVNRISFSRRCFFVAFEDTLIRIDREVLGEMYRTASAARKKGFTKKDLKEGPSVKRWNDPELCKKIEGYLRNPIWELVVYAVE